MKLTFLISSFVFATLLLTASSLQAQYIEPDIRPASQPVSPLDFDLRNGATLNLNITNYGFGIGGQYRRVLSPMTELAFELQITNVKDSREQAFFSFFGQQIIPNKFNRVLSFPVLTGVRHRILSRYIEDNFRIYLQGMAGPAFTFVYPYFEDVLFTAENFPNAQNPDGLPLGVRINDRQINDVFQGWSDGEIVWGYAGKISASVDFGSGFSTLTSLEFGVNILYYPNGLQIMEPNSIQVFEGRVVGREIGGGFSADKWYLTPTITLMFGGMW